MVTAIVGLVTIIILYASAYRMCCRRKEKYHDTPKEVAKHVVTTLFTYGLQVFDTLSNVFLFLHYMAMEQWMQSILIITFTATPVFVLAMFCVEKLSKKVGCGNFARKHGGLQCCFMVLWFLLVIAFCPFAAILSTLVYVF